MKQQHPIDFFKKLSWIDGRPLIDMIEPYRQRIFEAAYEHDDGLEKDRPGTVSRVTHNLILCGRAKKNWKTGDLVLWSLYKLIFWLSWSGNQVYTLCNDEDQAADNLELGKLIIKKNPAIEDLLVVKQNIIERKDGIGFWQILPAGDIVGSHGKTYLLCGFDEIHGYKNWDILEAMQLDPSRSDAQQWLTSYASIYHKPGVPLFDLCANGWKGNDRRILFSWYGGDKSTDPDFKNASPEDRANPSRSSWEDQNYLEQQKGRLPSHKYRRLHLNLGGLPAGAAYSVEKVMGAVDRGVEERGRVDGLDYFAFVDMSGGSNDDACLAIAHREGESDEDGRAVLDIVMNQGQPPPFDPRAAVKRFAATLKKWKIFSVVGDNYAGNTFASDFENEGITYHSSELTKSELYEAIEAPLNAGRISLLDNQEMESQFLILVWRGGKIDHPAGDHDDFSNAAAGAIHEALERYVFDTSDLYAGGDLPQPDW